LNDVPLRNSGLQWLGEIPTHWEVWKVAHGFKNIGSGTTPKSEELKYYDGDIPWVTTSELRENIIEDTSTKLTELALQDYSTLKMYPVGTLLIAMYGATIGRLGILGIEATVNQACCVFAEPKVFDTMFFFYWLLYRRPILISLSSGGGQPNLNQEELKSLRVPLPPVEEQQAIVDYIESETKKLDEMRDVTTHTIGLLKERRVALIAAAVTGQFSVEVSQ
jgi:type I restriction enzyme S subunit